MTEEWKKYQQTSTNHDALEWLDLLEDFGLSAHENPSSATRALQPELCFC